MRVFILITLLTIVYTYSLFSSADNKIEIGRTESIQSVNESELINDAYEKDVYYVESEMKSNTIVFLEYKRI